MCVCVGRWLCNRADTSRNIKKKMGINMCFDMFVSSLWKGDFDKRKRGSCAHNHLRLVLRLSLELKAGQTCKYIIFCASLQLVRLTPKEDAQLPRGLLNG